MRNIVSSGAGLAFGAADTLVNGGSRAARLAAQAGTRAVGEAAHLAADGTRVLSPDASIGEIKTFIAGITTGAAAHAGAGIAEDVLRNPSTRGAVVDFAEDVVEDLSQSPAVGRGLRDAATKLLQDPALVEAAKTTLGNIVAEARRDPATREELGRLAYDVARAAMRDALQDAKVRARDRFKSGWDGLRKKSNPSGSVT